MLVMTEKKKPSERKRPGRKPTGRTGVALNTWIPKSLNDLIDQHISKSNTGTRTGARVTKKAIITDSLAMFFESQGYDVGDVDAD